MKMKILILFGLCIALPLQAADPLLSSLQQGLLEEEANHNLEAAIQSYQAVIQQNIEQRKIVATAIFRLGECYRKQGKNSEAAAQYERLTRDYTDQTTLLTLSQQNLVALGINSTNQPNVKIEKKKDMLIDLTENEEQKIQRLAKMLEDSPDLLDMPDKTNAETPLYEAVQKGQIQVVRYLLSKKADINLSSKDTPPLQRAAQMGNKSMVEFLLQNGASVDAVNSSGETSLMVAAREGHRVIVELLIKNKANINAQSKPGWTALTYASSKGLKTMVEVLLQNGADPNKRVSRQDIHTPLSIAVDNGKTAIVKLLLEHKADPNGGPRSTFISAVKKQDKELVRLLASHGANIEDKESFDYNRTSNSRYGTALHMAIENENWDMVDLLLEFKANTDARDSQNFNPVHYVIEKGNESLLKTMLSLKGAQKVELNPTNSVPLLNYAAGRNQTKLARILIEAGADLNLEYPDGNYSTPLIMAVMNCSKEFVELLLSKGANVNAVNTQNGKTALESIPKITNDEGLKTASVEIEKMLRHYGAKDDVTREHYISAIRGSATVRIFSRDTNNVNRHTLYEAIAGIYVPQFAGYANLRASQPTPRRSRAGNVPGLPSAPGIPPGLPASQMRLPGGMTSGGDSFTFPDFAHLTIRRLNGTNAADEIITKNLDMAFKVNDTSKDFPLQWGDIIEIPETDHLVTETPRKLDQSTAFTLNKALDRKVNIVIKDTTNVVSLTWNCASRTSEDGVIVFRQVPDQAKDKPPFSTNAKSFGLYDVVAGSQLLRSSSDIHKTKVQRIDPATGKMQEMSFNLEATGGTPEDLWLQDNDTIIIPDK